MTTPNDVFSARLNRRRWRAQAGRGSGFTLIELLITIGIIILILAMAVPVFRVMSGSGSIEGSQNMISAMLQRARSRAIGIQAPRGVFFFEDQASKRVGMVLVRIDEAGLLPNKGARVLELDDASEEMQLLPANVGIAFLLGMDPTAASPSTTAYRPYGLVAFDGNGRFLPIPSYTTAMSDTTPRYPETDPDESNRRTTLLRLRLKDNIGKPLIDQLGSLQPAADYPAEFSHAALMLYDKTGLPAATGSSPAQFDTNQKTWLDANGVALAVNRYTGTILRAE